MGAVGWTDANRLVGYTSFVLKFLDNYYTLQKSIAFYYVMINMGSCCCCFKLFNCCYYLYFYDLNSIIFAYVVI